MCDDAGFDRESIARTEPASRAFVEAGAVRMGSYRDRIGGAAASGSTRNVPASLLAPAAASRPARRTSIRAPSRPPPFTSKMRPTTNAVVPGLGTAGPTDAVSSAVGPASACTRRAWLPRPPRRAQRWRFGQSDATRPRRVPVRDARASRSRPAASRCSTLQPFPLAVSADLPLCFRLLTTIGQTRNAS